MKKKKEISNDNIRSSMLVLEHLELLKRKRKIDKIKNKINNNLK